MVPNHINKILKTISNQAERVHRFKIKGLNCKKLNNQNRKITNLKIKMLKEKYLV
jgi:hypothetical protein